MGLGRERHSGETHFRMAESANARGIPMQSTYSIKRKSGSGTTHRLVHGANGIQHVTELSMGLRAEEERGDQNGQQKDQPFQERAPSSSPAIFIP